MKAPPTTPQSPQRSRIASRRHHLCRRVAASAAAFLVVLAGTLALAAGPAAAAEPPKWHLTLSPSADYFDPAPFDSHDVYTLEAENIGGKSSDAEPIVLDDTVPDGLSAEAVQFYYEGFGLEPNDGKDLSSALCPSAHECLFPGPLASSFPEGVKHGERLIMQVRVGAPSDFLGSIEDNAEVSGGGATTAATTTTNQVDAEPPLGSGFHRFAAAADAAGQPSSQAGGHPDQLLTEMDFTSRTVRAGGGGWGRLDREPLAEPKDIVAELPPGLIGNPQAIPHCALADFFFGACEINTVVGTVGIAFSESQGAFDQVVPLFNLQPSGEFPGELGYTPNGIPFFLTVTVRSGSDYGLDITNAGTPQVTLTRTYVTTWGIPAAHEHDKIRGKGCKGGPSSHGEAWSSYFIQSPAQVYRDCELTFGSLGNLHGGPAETPEVPFLTMPTSCSGEPLAIGARYDTWELPPGEEGHATAVGPPVDGCNQLKFEPTIEARPTTNLADAPSGFDFNLKVPQNTEGPEGKESPTGVATADLKEATVTLPPGLVVNPSSGAGLEGCSPAQIGLTTPVATVPAHFTETPAACPDASKLGTVEVNTALLHNPLLGAVYLATPHQNPSGNLLAGYIVLEGEGLIIKLAGQFQTDPATGQITASFLENPQTPFEEFKFHFFAGARGALRTPAVCGTYEVHSTLTPWSAPEFGPPAEPAGEFETVAGPTGGACPTSAGQEPHSPVLRAGTESPAAGLYSPFSLKLVRQDGEQEIKGIETTLPEGLVGRLAGTSYCPDAALAAAASKSGAAEQSSPSCPASSEVGTVAITAGAGPTPLNVAGKAYLAGPYKGAPLSLAIITPAVAGPFDLGDVVVRTALFVDPLTTQITAKSDPIPTILEGIPLDVRSITLQVNRPRFTLNPTSCEPMAITGSALSALGASTALTQRFQVGGCPALPFKPSLKISLKGSTKHAGHPGLKAVLTYPKGGPYANVAKALVNLPHSEFIDQGNLNKTCTRPVLLEGACPAKSIYGKAKAWTPLLEKPLEGPVYLVGGFGYKLPALVAELDGQIRVLLVGKVDSGKNKGIRNTFEAVPDAPVEKFVLEMKGGPKYSLLENSENLCARPQKAIASFTAQSGKVLDLHPTVANDCKKKGKKHKGKKHHGGHAGGHGKGGRGTSSSRALAAVLPRGW